MLVFHNHCQLGNQMFIYACAHSLAKKRRSRYCLSDLGDLTYFNLSEEDYTSNSKKWLWFRVKNKFKKFKFEHLQDNRIDYSDKIAKEYDKNLWYYGYFQGEKYFYNNQLEVKSRFEIKDEFKLDFQSIREDVCGNADYTIVHIRLSDYKTFGPNYLNGPDLTLPYSYYHNLLKTVVKKGEMVIFLSDSIEEVKKEFSYVANAFFSENNVINDLQFIMNANKAILSCSTFSWWGAWLNKNENLEVYVPEYFLGFKVQKEYPINILPDSWIKVTVK